MTELVLRNVEVEGQSVNVSIIDDTIDSVSTDPALPDTAQVVDGHGGTLLPGLWDHHIHLVALAAARNSVPVGPPDVTNARELEATLARHRPSDPTVWLRGVGYHESVAGLLDRDDLDRLAPGTPVRIQHRSGALWILNSEAIHQLGIDRSHREGLERDPQGNLTGRLYGNDRWLRERMSAVAPQPPPDLAAVGRELASYGVIGVTDATPYDRPQDLELLAEATSTGALPQHVIATGGPALAGSQFPAPLRQGPVKIRLADHALPSLDRVIDWILTAHTERRPIAVHCVTRESLVLTLAALDDAGSIAGDRIEHGAVVPPELHEPLRRRKLTVVTQPNFIAERGDQYLTDVEADDQPHLYPCASLQHAGIRVAGSTDAPFGHPNPWHAIAAAVERRTRAGEIVGAHESVAFNQAFALFQPNHLTPGSTPHAVRPGLAADLCLLTTRLDDAPSTPPDPLVAMTIIRGDPVWVRADLTR